MCGIMEEARSSQEAFTHSVETRTAGGPNTSNTVGPHMEDSASCDKRNAGKMKEARQARRPSHTAWRPAQQEAQTPQTQTDRK